MTTNATNRPTLLHLIMTREIHNFSLQLIFKYMYRHVLRWVLTGNLHWHFLHANLHCMHMHIHVHVIHHTYMQLLYKWHIALDWAVLWLIWMFRPCIIAEKMKDYTAWEGLRTQWRMIIIACSLSGLRKKFEHSISTSENSDRHLETNWQDLLPIHYSREPALNSQSGSYWVRNKSGFCC